MDEVYILAEDQRQSDPAHNEQQELNTMLAQLARQGNREALAQLWEINQGLLRSIFWKWYPSHKEQADAHGMTAEDFEQEGFFAVQYAAQTYDPEQGSFSNWLWQSMRRQIVTALSNGHRRKFTGQDGRSSTTSADPLNHCRNLDEPLPGGEDDFTLADTVPDPAAIQEFEGVEEAIYREQLRAVLDKALSLLPDRQREVIQKRFFEGLNFKQIAKDEGISVTRAAQIEAAGRRAMGRNAALRRFYGENLLAGAYHGTGFETWACGGSVEERIVEQQEEEEQRLAVLNAKELAELLSAGTEEQTNL